MTATALNSTETQPRTLCWQSATWDDYVQSRETLDAEQFRLFFHQGYLLVHEMGWEGINHAAICDLFTMMFVCWFGIHPEQQANSLGRCLLEKEKSEAGAPDLVLYLEDDYPRWQPGETLRINLNQWRVPDLVGEISDTTLASDLDQKKRLYAALGIPEYWVVDVRGQRVFAFILQTDGIYQLCDESQVLPEVKIAILEETVNRLGQESNISAALWFRQQLSTGIGG